MREKIVILQKVVDKIEMRIKSQFYKKKVSIWIKSCYEKKTKIWKQSSNFLIIKFKFYKKGSFNSIVIILQKVNLRAKSLWELI